MKKIFALIFSFVLTLSLVSIVSAAEPTNLVGWWKLDEISGEKAIDSSESPVDGDVYEAIMGVDGMYNTAYQFDGIDDYVQIPHADKLDMKDSYSIEAWVYAEDDLVNKYRPIIFRGGVDSNDIEIYIQANSKDLIVAHNRSNTGSFDYVGFDNPPLGDWFNLAVVFDGTNVTAYYDGVAAAVVQQNTALVKPLDTDKDWWLGKVDHSAFGTLSGGKDDNYFKGYLDDVRIWDTALTEDDLMLTDTELAAWLDPDDDDDGVLDDDDKCPDTISDAPTDGLGTNRWQYTENGWITKTPKGNGQKEAYTITDTYGCSCDQILTEFEEKIEEEFEGHHKFGCSKSILEDWIAGEYYIGPTFLETVKVLSDGSITESTNTLESGKDYFLKSYGSYRFANWGDYGIADTEWSYRNGSYYPTDPEYTDVVPDEGSTTSGWVKGEGYFASQCGLDIQVDNSCVDWGWFDSEHNYQIDYAGNDSPVSFHIYDNAYGDNSGNLYVDIIEDKWVDLW